MEILTTKSDFVFAGENPTPATNLSNDALTWQQHLKAAVRTSTELLQRLNLTEITSPSNAAPAIQAVATFPVFVPLPFLARIRRGDPHDPLLLQVLPSQEEDADVNGYSRDPLGESLATRSPGLLHKYHGRVLLVTTGACAINCRYCFRRHFPYQDSPSSPSQWKTAIEQIAADESISEVILSGGDPLMLVDESLGQLIEQLDAIPHLQRLRIHTRLPIMIPDRVTTRLLEILSDTKVQTIVVIHANHANELDHDVQAALEKLANTGTMLLNQSVLLRGVNDEAQTLIQLSERLLKCRVLPYYLHKNDPIAGTAHFEVSIQRGIELMKKMRACLPGYAIPGFVQEIAGQPNKTVLA